MFVVLEDGRPECVWPWSKGSCFCCVPTESGGGEGAGAAPQGARRALAHGKPPLPILHNLPTLPLMPSFHRLTLLPFPAQVRAEYKEKKRMARAALHQHHSHLLPSGPNSSAGHTPTSSASSSPLPPPHDKPVRPPPHPPSHLPPHAFPPSLTLPLPPASGARPIVASPCFRRRLDGWPELAVLSRQLPGDRAAHARLPATGGGALTRRPHVFRQQGGRGLHELVGGCQHVAAANHRPAARIARGDLDQGRGERCFLKHGTDVISVSAIQPFCRRKQAPMRGKVKRGGMKVSAPSDGHSGGGREEGVGVSSAILRHIGLTAGKGQCVPSHSSGSQTSETTTEQMIPCWRMSHTINLILYVALW